MKLHYHADTDSLYIALSPKPSADSDEVVEGVALDFDAEGRLWALISTMRATSSTCTKLKPSIFLSRPPSDRRSRYAIARVSR